MDPILALQEREERHPTLPDNVDLVRTELVTAMRGGVHEALRGREPADAEHGGGVSGPGAGVADGRGLFVAG